MSNVNKDRPTVTIRLTGEAVNTELRDSQGRKTKTVTYPADHNGMRRLVDAVKWAVREKAQVRIETVTTH